LGLHHASITIGFILAFGLIFKIIGLIFGLISFSFWIGGQVGAVWGAGWYCSREYGNGPYPPRSFELMDFVSPLIVCILFFVLLHFGVFPINL